MIRVVDTRSGQDVAIGETVNYGDGEWWKLVVVTDFFFHASATVHTPQGIQHVPLIVRFAHPDFFLQRVWFFPS